MKLLHRPLKQSYRLHPASDVWAFKNQDLLSEIEADALVSEVLKKQRREKRRAPQTA